jgi:2-keto-4-pentenoate hydratase/2-oxohepta-3-ene-1,7-dioic acid hydratase in catechol pathway
MGNSEIPKQPLIFQKPWSALAYTPNKLHLPISKIHRVDHELELGVFISKGGSNIKKEDALSHVGGYFIGIDFTDRSRLYMK